MGIQDRIVTDFGMILGPHFVSFSGAEGYKSGVIFGFVSMSLLTPISASNSGLLKRGFRMEGMAKTAFRRSRFFHDFP